MKKVKTLKDHAQFHADLVDVGRLVGQILAVDDNAAGSDGFQLIDGAQQGTLAGTAGADDDHLLAGKDVEGDVVQGPELTEELGDVADADDRVSVGHGLPSFLP